MDYEIIVPDLDGTLTNRNKIIIPRTREVLMNAQETGNVVVLASGRPTASVEPLARELELSRLGGYVLSYNGRMITNCKTGEAVFSSLLPGGSNQRTIRLAREHRVDIFTCGGEEITINNVECPYTIVESSINHLSPRQVEDMKSYVDFKVSRLLMLDDGDYLVTVEPKVKTVVDRDLSVYRSELYLLEIMPKGIDKTRSLARLLEMLRLDRKQMIAYDDDYNDLTMTKYTGLGMAMGNTVLLMGQAADYITASSNHGDVGLVIKKLMLS